MKNYFARGIIAPLLIAMNCLGQAQYEQQQQPSEGERQAVVKIRDAKDAASKLQAAAEFVKKYPKSTMRKLVAVHVASSIASVQDDAQRVALCEKFLTTFNGPGEDEYINSTLIDAYLKLKRLDEAFQRAAAALEKNPDDVVLLTNMALIGTDQAKRGNAKFLQQSQQYGAKAIELIEADKKPASVEAAQWSEYKARWLPSLYQSLGILSLLAGNNADAIAKIEKAAALNSTDPFNYMLLGNIVNQEYQKTAEQYGKARLESDRAELLKKAHSQLDQIIDLYARAVALSEGRPEYQQLREQILQDLESYYKYRHGGSTDGLQQLIDKYKKQ